MAKIVAVYQVRVTLREVPLLPDEPPDTVVPQDEPPTNEQLVALILRAFDDLGFIASASSERTDR